MPETTEIAKKKVSIRQVRDGLLMLKDANDPDLASDAQNEARTRAMANLLAILCDRVTELGIETGQNFIQFHQQDQECIAAIHELAGKLPGAGNGATAPAQENPGKPMSAEETAAAELAALPAGLKTAPIKVAPAGSTADAATKAATINGSIGVPSLVK